MSGLLNRLLKSASKVTTAANDAGALNPTQAGQLHWVCNICGTANLNLASTIDRESGHCSHCNSVMRFRSLTAVLTQHLFGKTQILASLPINRAITGIGMSDAHLYAQHLEAKLSYTNTFYHCEPLLDITNPTPQRFEHNDFIITSDVFEHVPPPVQRGFDNMFKLLKPGGVVIFSVPYVSLPDTDEHYPNLFNYSLTQDAQGEWLLHNTTRDGQQETFKNLIFHGGPGSTLEMRLFTESALRKHFADAGFVDLQIHDQPCFEHGIYWQGPCSITMSARRPQ
jgi:SAM-dependent methyltransferase